MRMIYFTYWTQGRGLKGSMNQAMSVLPSVLSSGSFIGIGLLDFFETQHGLQGPCEIVSDRAGYFRKNAPWAKITQNGQK